MGNWITALGIPEVAEGLLCCATTAFTGIFSKSTLNHSRFAFSVFLFLGTVSSFLVLVPNMRHILDKIPYFCSAITTDEMCDGLVGYSAVYRICFSLCIFYMLFAILMINTTSTSDIRFKIHSGYWFLKLVLLGLLLVAAFHIPRHALFGKALMYAGLTGGFMFIIIQVLLVIDFSYSWSVSWAEKADSGNTRLWYIALACSTILTYSIAITMAIFFYLYFTNIPDLSKCRGNVFLITFNVSHCFLASLISVFPRVQEETQGSGLLQSSVISLYAMYLTWCTLSSEPDGSCNPLGDVILDYDQASGVNGQALFDSVLMFALLLFACNVRSNTSKLVKIGCSLSKITYPQHYYQASSFDETSTKQAHGKNVDCEKDTGAKNFKDEEEKFIEYNYSYFHFIMCLASLQLMMVVTNWHSPDELADMKKLVKNWATVWIQLSSSILCVLIYIWATVAPLVMRTWGPCLGLDYDLVPTFDDHEYGKLQRTAKAIQASDEHLEAHEIRKKQADAKQQRQLTTDSGMCDSNMTQSYSTSRYTSENARVSKSAGEKIGDLSGDTGNIRWESSGVCADTVVNMEKCSDNESLDELQLEQSSATNSLRNSKEIVGNSQSNTDEWTGTRNLSATPKRSRNLTTDSLGELCVKQSAAANSLKSKEILGNSQSSKDERTDNTKLGKMLKRARNLSTNSLGKPQLKQPLLHKEQRVRKNMHSSIKEQNDNIDLEVTPQTARNLSIDDSSAQIDHGSSNGTSGLRNNPEEFRELKTPTTTLHGSSSDDKCCTKVSLLSNVASSSSLDGVQPKMLRDARSRHSDNLSKRTLVSRKPLSSSRNKSRNCSRSEKSEFSEDSVETSQETLTIGNFRGKKSRCQSRLSDVSGTSREVSEHKSDQLRPPLRPHARSNVQRKQKRREGTSDSNGDCCSSGKYEEKPETVRQSLGRPGNTYPQMQDHIAWVKQLRKARNIPAIKNISTNATKWAKSNEEKEKTDLKQISAITETSAIDCTSQQRLNTTGSALPRTSASGKNKKDKKYDSNFAFVHAHGERTLVSGPQPPEVSKEIMRIQAKILKFQAKVVETQQQILEIQKQDGAGRHDTESQLDTR